MVAQTSAQKKLEEANKTIAELRPYRQQYFAKNTIPLW